MGKQPATGRSTRLLLGPELALGQPDDTATPVEWQFIPPLGAGLKHTESESAEITRGGFKKKGLPGPVTGEAFDLATAFSAGRLIEPMVHLMGHLESKTEVETGAFQYVVHHVKQKTHLQSFGGYYDLEPIRRWRMYGIKLQELGWSIGDNNEIPVRAKGQQLHGSELGPGVADVGNAGTYAYTPVVRGPLLDRAGGAIHVQVASTSPLTFRVEQGAAPTWAGPTHEQLYDETGESLFVECRGPDGFDLGIVSGENKDPLEAVFPGRAADHADLAVGDTWTFAPIGGWQLPAATQIATPRMTSAHWRFRIQAQGAPSFSEVKLETGSYTITDAMQRRGGSGSRYAHDLERQAMGGHSCELKRGLVSDYFLDGQQRRTQYTAEHRFEGPQIGTSGTYREGMVLTWPKVGLYEHDAAVANADRVEETIKLEAEDTEDGSPSAIAVITTTRNIDIASWI
ncbi:MAG: hypothetical protein AAGC60_00310 [Acidobacteriota bacterium]